MLENSNLRRLIDSLLIPEGAVYFVSLVWTGKTQNTFQETSYKQQKSLPNKEQSLTREESTMMFKVRNLRPADSMSLVQSIDHL